MAKKTEELATRNKYNVPSSAERKAVQKIFDQIPDEELIQVLVESGDDRAATLAEMMSDPAYSRTGFAVACAKARFNPKDVWQLVIDNRKLDAQLRMSQRLGAVVEAVADLSVPQPVPCRTCKGTGEIAAKEKDGEPTNCAICGGVGEVLKEASLEAAKVALEIGGMINQKVPLVAQQFINNPGGKGGASGVDVPDMSDWSRTTDAVFEERDRKVEEGEIVG